MRSRRGYLPLIALLAIAIAIVPLLASARATTPGITAVDPYSWQANGTSPAMVAVMAGGEVKFSYPSGASHHFPILHSGPAGGTPSCTNLPTTEITAGPGWSGSCTFSQAGTYVFYCGVHGALMQATVTVTTPGAPTATTGTASTVGKTGATLEGAVNPQEKATTYHFNYGTTASYGLSTPEEPAGAGNVDEQVSATVTGLTPGTTYHYQLVAKNGSATTPGADRTFTTEFLPGAPTATTGLATALTETGATLKGTVNPDGEPTKYFFEWGTTSSYGHLTSELSAGEDHNGHPESAPLTGLTPGTPYHFRLLAMNTSGPSAGTDEEFTTASPSPPSPISPPVTKTTPSPAPPTSPPLFTPLPAKSEEAHTFGLPLIGGSLKLTAPRHSSSLRGSIEVAQAGAGGRLEVDLLAKGALVKAGSKSVRVGRLLRQSLSAGKVSFSVVLTAQGKRALIHHHSLPLTVKITLTPTQGKTESVTQAITLRS